MRYVNYTSGAGPELMCIADTDKPTPNAGQVCIKVHGFGVNRADTLQRLGKYPPPPGESEILGLEVSGVIDEVGEGVTHWQPGQPVFGLVPGGGYAEYVCVDARHIMSIPEGLSMTEAAGVAEVFLTAFQSLFWLGNLQSGQRAVIHAGASGVGLAAVQLARSQSCSVAVTASSEEKLSACQEAGAELLVNYQQQDFAERITNAWKGVDMVLDMVGGDYLNRNLQVLNRDGRIVYLAMLAGRFADRLDLGLLLGKRAQIIGSTLRNRDDDYKARLIADFQQRFLPLFTDRRLQPVIDTVYRAEEVGEAHQRLQANQSIGKCVCVW